MKLPRCLILLLVAIATCACSVEKETGLNLTALDKWDVVIIGDSTLWGIGEALAQKIETEYGMAVDLHDFAFGNLTARQALEAIRTSEPSNPNAAMHGWPEILREAEYVVLNPSTAESISAVTPGDWECFYPPYYVDECSLASFEAFQADLRQIVLEILALRGDQPIVIRFGSYWGRPGNWVDESLISTCIACLETYSLAIGEIAAEFGIPYAGVMDQFNGVNHDQDPDDLGYIGDDRVHANQTGVQVITDQIWQLGIEPVQP
jgi:hypothetical protein